MNKESLVATNREMSASGVKTPELEKRPSIGTVLVIVAIDRNKNGENAQDPKIWTILEKKSKNYTDKQAGQISLPADTRKDGEDILSNMLGTLPEFSNDNALIRSLVLMPSSYVKGRLTVKGGPVDLAVLILGSSSNEQIIPLDEDEVSPNGWMSLKDLRKEREINPSHLRGILAQTVDLERSDNIIYNVVEDYFNDPGKRVSISTFLSSETSLSELFKQRERLPDVIGSSGIIYEPVGAK